MIKPYLLLLFILLACDRSDNGDVFITSVTPSKGGTITHGTIGVHFNDPPSNLTVSGAASWQLRGTYLSIQVNYWHCGAYGIGIQWDHGATTLRFIGKNRNNTGKCPTAF